MYQSISVSLLNLVLSLSDALDLASPVLSQHQLRTAFVVWEAGRAMELSPDSLLQAFIAALFHDVGALTPESKINIHQVEVCDPEGHCILGERLLNHVPMFELAARAVRLHHHPWSETQGDLRDPALLAAQLIQLGDTIERSIDRNRYILHQQAELQEKIQSLSGTTIHPTIVEIFRPLGVREDFWLDLVSPRLYSLLLHKGPGRGIEIDFSHLLTISELFRNMIDFRSHFTAAHSSGVAAAASALAQRFGLTQFEIELMEVTGNLHDLGKMVIPNAILEKPGRLTPQEYAIMRQHTYFTYTVLNTIGGIQQIAQWAAFHHERLDGSGYPFHLTGKSLDVGARIMSVADIFTALTEDRPYRQSVRRGETMAILKDLAARRQLDAHVVDVLETYYDEISEAASTRQARAREDYERRFANLSDCPLPPKSAKLSRAVTEPELPNDACLPSEY